MPQNPPDSPLYRAEVFYGCLFLVVIAILGGGSLFWRGRNGQTWWNAPTSNHATTATPVGEPSVLRRMDVDGAPYLLWSNGQITPDMAAHRKYILRTVAAQALLESQAAEQPSGR